MNLKFNKLIAELAIFLILTICNADELKDPEVFIKDSLAVLNKMQDKCQYLTDYVETIDDTNDIIKKSKICGEKLFKIANIASGYDLTKIENIETKETIKLLRNIEKFYKIGEDIKVLYENHVEIESLYSNQDIEYYDDNDITYSIEEILKDNFITRTEDVNEINYYWNQVADKVGTYTWVNFFPFIELIQGKATEYNLTAIEFWFPNYNEETLIELENFMMDLQPFYQQLHTYIRFKLLNRYGAGVVKTHGPIPETLYQQITDRIWLSDNHYEEDFPSSNIPNLDDFYTNHKISSEKLIDLAEKFYTSLGFETLDEEYRNKHIISENENCTEYVDDKYANNVTLNYCKDVVFENFLSYHEYMGRIYGAVYQKDVPWLYWGNNFYGQIIGRSVRLAAETKKQQELLNLMPDDISEHWMITDNVNMAFMEVFDLMRRYVNIRVITDILSNKVEKDAINKHYWDLFEKYAGVEPPVDRTEDSLDIPYWLVRDVFDNINLIRDFKVRVLTFDVYAAACHLTEHTGPLNECTFYKNIKVGDAFQQILKTGLKKPFDETIKPLISDYKHLNTEALLDYFKPTFTWMTQYNKKHNLTTGWDRTKKSFSEEALTNEEEATTFVEVSSARIYKLYDQIASDIFTKKNEDKEFDSEFYGNVYWKISKAAEAATELTEISMKAKQFDNTKFKSKPLRKAILKLTEIADVFVLGEDLENFIYNKQRLQNLSLDNDIIKYKDTSDDSVTVPYNPYILNIFKTSNDSDELKYYWTEWRETNGAFAKALLLDLLKSFEKAANILEISTTEFWFKQYSNDYVKKMENIIDSVKPFYHQLHNFVYRKLVKKYNETDFSMGDSSIPDHFIQQVLAQIWTNDSIVEDDFPYHNLPPHDQGIIDKKYDALQLLKTAEKFYQSLGFEPLKENFWNERVKVEEGSAADGDCHATVLDLTPKVYMKYCERVSFRKFLQSHGYIGRVFYAVEKKDLPAYYFDSYDFEYPVGEAVILSASTPKHSEKNGLIAGFEVTDTVLLNRLIRMAIHTMFNLHKYFVHTKVIAEYLEGEIEEIDITKTYWKYMISYAGIEPPSDRRDDLFDFPFEFYTDLEQNHQVRKFTSEVLGYRIYEHLCKLSNHKGDLNNCDFFDSIEAGNALKSMMKLGSSLKRRTVLKRLLGDASDLNAHSMLAYYQPLEKWLNEKLTDFSESSFDSYRKSLHTEFFV